MVDFDAIRNIDDLALNLSCRTEDLLRLADIPQQQRFYLRIEIPKKGYGRWGQYRTVYKVVDRTLRLLHKNLEETLSARIEFPRCVQGFVRGRSIATNASFHLAKQLVLTADIEHFFESIDTERVIAIFCELGCRPTIAEILGRICTLQGVLPQGSSVSPVLANLACKELDREFVTP